jgi:hypothetical protein
MAHTAEEKKKLLVRVNRIQGQLQSIREAIEEERECGDVLQQIAACRGAVQGCESRLARNKSGRKPGRNSPSLYQIDSLGQARQLTRKKVKALWSKASHRMIRVVPELGIGPDRSATTG